MSAPKGLATVHELRPAGGGTASVDVATAVKLSRSNLDRLNDEARLRVVSRNLILDAALNEWFDRHAEGGAPR